MVGAALLWGSAYPATRYLVAEMPILAATSWRGLAALVALLVVVLLRRDLVAALPRPAQWSRLAMLALLAGPAFVIGQNAAVQLTGPSVTSFVAGSYPILAVLISPLLLPERLNGRVIVALVAAVAGTLLLARPGGANVDAIGVVAALGASLAFALYLVLARRWSTGAAIRPMQVALTNMTMLTVVGGVLQLLLVAPAGLVPELSAAGWAGLLWVAVPCGAGAHLLAMGAVARLPAGRSSPFLLLAPVTGALVSAVLVGERLDIVQLVGGALIVGAIALATLTVRPRTRSMPA
jgi:probable blue pigment (indigoidine) exporter